MQIEQIKRGLTRYVDNEIIAQMTDAKNRWITGGVAALAINNLDKTVMQYADNPWMAMLGVVQGSDIDVDALYKAFAPKMVDKVSFELPFIGKLTFDQRDMDKLLQYIKEG